MWQQRFRVGIKDVPNRSIVYIKYVRRTDDAQKSRSFYTYHPDDDSDAEQEIWCWADDELDAYKAVMEEWYG